MKALFIGGPCDGQILEVRGRYHQVASENGYHVYDFHQMLSEDGSERWIFAVEKGKTGTDVMNALVERYRKEC